MRINWGLIAIFCFVGCAANSGGAVNVSGTIAPVGVFGSDNQHHLVYELNMEQTAGENSHHYELMKIEIFNKKNHQLIAQYEGERLKPLVYLIRPDGTSLNTTELDKEGQLIAFPYLAFANKKEIPSQLIHRLQFIDKAAAGKKSRFKAVIKRSKEAADEIVSPVQGGGWLACNGPGILSSHRFAYLNVHGTYFLAQRFAIDWNRIDEKGNVFYPGSDNKMNESYLDYGADIYSATAGTVSKVRNEFLDNIPGEIPEAVQNVDNACGNEVTVAMDNGHYAHYCHLKPDSIKVTTGERVKPGQLLAALGNSGNSMGPHLHFHISDNPSVLGSEGLPFTISNFGLQLTPEVVEETGILDFHPSETSLMDINLPGEIKNNAMPMQNGVYYFSEH
ncbi:M23 family metallopeptidase [Legionella shakespearei]|uniref:Secreted peptidase n=1 Tax=Legionella shakespearei DSM 23087 TaxID=1122169 RepID=A0A0W0Z9V9_9GAMM|nr:M23 family metallopeptidase [Legionella shakespearei]KTD65839.1 secreted peptidase [Legionella shakespearei DSM 23087]